MANETSAPGRGNGATAENGTPTRPEASDAERRWRDRTGKLKLGPAKTSSGIDLNPLYSARDLRADADEAIGFPGDYPFTRGVQPTMYRGRLWTMRQYSGFGTADETNQRYRWLLEQTGVSVALHMRN